VPRVARRIEIPLSHAYLAPGAVRSHAVLSVTSTGSAAGTRTFGVWHVRGMTLRGACRGWRRRRARSRTCMTRRRSCAAGLFGGGDGFL